MSLVGWNVLQQTPLLLKHPRTSIMEFNSFNIILFRSLDLITFIKEKLRSTLAFEDGKLNNTKANLEMFSNINSPAAFFMVTTFCQNSMVSSGIVTHTSFQLIVNNFSILYFHVTPFFFWYKVQR